MTSIKRRMCLKLFTASIHRKNIPAMFSMDRLYHDNTSIADQPASCLLLRSHFPVFCLLVMTNPALIKEAKTTCMH